MSEETARRLSGLFHEAGLLDRLGESIPGLVYVYDLADRRNVFTNRPLADLLARDEPAELQLCLWEGAATTANSDLGAAAGKTLASLPPSLPAGARIRLLVGPEGGLSRDEVENAQARGFTIVGVGPRILRTETAGPAIIAVLQARFGDLGSAG